MPQRLTPDDLHNIQSPEEIAEIFVKLGYDASAQPIAVKSLELPSRSAEAIAEAYLLASHRQGNDTFQILLFQLHPEEFASYSLARNRMKLIANSLCQRPAKYLLIATRDYQQLLLVSPSKELDKQLNLVVTVESCLIDLKEPSYQNRNWLEKLTPQHSSPQLLLEKQRLSIQAISEIQQDSAELFTEDAVRIYLREIGRIPLLTASEEIELARRVVKFVEMERVRQQLRQQLQREPTNREWAAATPIPLLAHRVGKKAQSKLVQANLRLVVSIAKRYQGRGLELLDLIQEGSMGLIRATEKFDPERGYKFSTYATWWIRQGCTRAVSQRSRLIRVPVHLYEKASQLKRTTRILSQRLNRRPTEAEIAAEMQLDLDKLRQLIQVFQPIVSLDCKVGEEQDTTLQDLIESEERFGEKLEQLSVKKQLEELLNELKPREAEVIKLRHGWNDGEEKTLQEIGNLYGLTRERVRQIEVKAMRKLCRRASSLYELNCVLPKVNPYKLTEVIGAYPAEATRQVQAKSTSVPSVSCVELNNSTASDVSLDNQPSLVALAESKIREYFQSSQMSN